MTIFSREEVEGKLAASEARVEARLAHFEAMMTTGFAELRADMAKLQAEMHKNTADTIKWVVSTMLALAAASVVILTFVVNNAVTRSASPRQPMVVVVPGPGAVPAQPPMSGAPPQRPN